MLEIRHDRMDDTSATQAAYNDIYRNQGILLRDSFYLWLIGLLRPVPGKSLLDISCGQGRLVVLAQRQGLRALGVDFAIDGIYRGILESPGSGWLVGDGERLPFPDGCIDYVTHIGSLEHYQNPDCGASEIGRVMKRDGKACILLPNAYGLLGNVLYVLRTGDIFDDGQPLQRYGTCQFWQRLLERGGLRVEKIVGYGEVEFPRTKQDATWLLRHPQKILRFVMNAFIPTNLSNQLVFICRRV